MPATAKRVFLAAMLLAVFAVAGLAADNPFDLDLPSCPVPDRVSLTRGIGPKQKHTWAELDGPGCIKHIWVTLKHPLRSVMANRKMLIRIFFDGSPTPHVEGPIGDFFGVMHGVDYYDVNTPFLSVKEYSGYNCYFDMPFAGSARIELETGPEGNHCYMQVDWHRYPDQSMREKRRFCARWRKENPTERYGEDFLMLDANGPGQLIGFVYGVRLIDNVDRWSHGGAENIYIDGEGEHPAFLRGIGGEDTFGTSYGGAHHPPETHLHAGMPYYYHEDIGEARRAQRLVGYRFFTRDAVPFRESIHMRFGCMENNICSMVYWYQEGLPRSFVRMPDFAALLPDAKLTGGVMDQPLPDCGSWAVRAPIENKNGKAIQDALSKPAQLDTRSEEKWQKRAACHGFIDFNHVSRPHRRGVGVHHINAVGQARAILDVPKAGEATIRLAWDDRLLLRVNDGKPIDLGEHRAFRARQTKVPLRQGRNLVTVTLSNTTGTNHGGWCFAFRATSKSGRLLRPAAPEGP